jgi:predicted RNA-binding protein with EMAP domain
VVPEVVYVLESFYELPRPKVADLVRAVKGAAGGVSRVGKTTVVQRLAAADHPFGGAAGETLTKCFWRAREERDGERGQEHRGESGGWSCNVFGRTRTGSR